MQNQNIRPWAWGSGQPFSNNSSALQQNLSQGGGLGQNPLMQGYSQLYGNIAQQPPPNYGQWSATQIQQWQQWQQWQQKYQQWQNQYGKKYVESLAAAVQGLAGVAPGISPAMGTPDMNVPPPKAADPPLPTTLQPVPPPPPEEEKPPLPGAAGKEGTDGLSRNNSQASRSNSEELSEAEKAFDVQFKQWENQFSAWKKENQDHPDKAQYKEYEKKWEAWREQLLMRREQMRKKRLGQTVDNVASSDNTGKSEENNTRVLIPNRDKPDEIEHKGQPPANLPPNLDNQPPLNQSSGGLDHRGNKEENSSFSSKFGSFPPNNFSGFQDKATPFSGGPNAIRRQGPFGGPAGDFDSSNNRGYNQGLDTRFGGFGKDSSDGLRLRNPNQGGGLRFGGSKFDTTPPWQRFGQNDWKSSGNFGSQSRFSCDNFRSDKDLDGQRLGNKEDEKNFGDTSSRITDTSDFRSGFGNSLLDSKTSQNFPARPKVPSLFDITVEKPPGFLESNNDQKPRAWEKSGNIEKEDSFDFKSKERETDRPWANNNSRNKGLPSPWLQPWEIEKMNAQKLQENRTLDLGFRDTGSPWLKKQEIDRAELSGYVGNLLAKLGQFSGTVPLLEKIVGGGNNGGNRLGGNDANDRFGGFGGNRDELRSEPDKNSFSQSDDGNSRGFGDSESVKEHSDRTPFEGKEPDGVPPRDSNSPRWGVNSGRSNTMSAGDGNRLPPEDGNGTEPPFLRDGKDVLLREDGRNFGRPGSRNDWRNAGVEDRTSRIDEIWSFNRGPRGERDFSRPNFRRDIDMRLGGGRHDRRTFDRFGRDENGRELPNRLEESPFDNRPWERSGPAEPVWKPQVFDYSQGRPTSVNDDEGFKISTVVDYSHGENKEAFNFAEAKSGEIETKTFDYGHTTDAAPTVIDYGHGFDKKPLPKDSRRDRRTESNRDIDDRRKNNEKNSRSPSKERFRSRSRSPYHKYRRASESPSTFKSDRSKNRDGSDRQGPKRKRRDSNDELSRGGGASKRPVDVTTISVEDLLCAPGRDTRPVKLVFLIRGIPGSGKTYVTKLIKDKEIEMGGDAPRILSLDDYFMTEVEKEVTDEETGRKVKTKALEYEYEAAAEPYYRSSLVKAFKKTISDGFFSFIIVDSVNEKTKDYEEMWSFAKQKGFQVYVAEMDNDIATCTSRNIHKRSEKEISDLAKSWEETPRHYLRLDVRSLIQSDAIADVEMEVVSDTDLDKCLEDEGLDEDNASEEGKKKADEAICIDKNDDNGEGNKEVEEDEEDEESGASTFVKSRWDQFENSEPNLDRLDGLKRCRERFHATMEDYLQLPDDIDDIISGDAAPGKKKVRWADLEERRQQEKMRAIGFVVGQTDWSRMTDPTFGESALTKTKYI